MLHILHSDIKEKLSK